MDVILQRYVWFLYFVNTNTLYTGLVDSYDYHSQMLRMKNTPSNMRSNDDHAHRCSLVVCLAARRRTTEYSTYCTVGPYGVSWDWRRDERGVDLTRLVKSIISRKAVESPASMSAALTEGKSVGRESIPHWV